MLIHFAKLWGYGALLVVNLNAFRSSSPIRMMAAVDPFGPENGEHLRTALFMAKLRGGGRLLVAWGNAGHFNHRDISFILAARRHGVELICLGHTSDTSPKHPMARGKHRIPRDQQPIIWRTAT